jgi:Xaa-Pro aminopeptidase
VGADQGRVAKSGPAGRLAALRARLGEQGVEAVLITHGENVAYLSGFTGGADGALVISAAEAVLVSDFRYDIQARRQAPDFSFHQARVRLVDGIAEVIRERGFHFLGFERTDVSYDTFTALGERLPGVGLTPLRNLVERLRVVKDATEVAAIRRAAALADEAVAHAQSLLAPGAVEAEIAVEVEAFLRRRGSEPLPFPLIIAAGDNSALPHATVSDRRLEAGDLVVVDLGARTDGYCSDITRTFAVGAPTDEQRAIYRLVWEAQRRGLEAVRAGAAAAEVDAVARDFLAEGGHGDHFGHGLGHGVGREVHEAPRLGKQSDDRLEAGMVVTVEPGIYIEGWGGVRIEDLVLVTEDGCEILSRAPKPEEVAAA